MENRQKYQQLLKANGISQAQSAALITAVTHRPCAARTVRSWLNDPEKPTSRPCPDWAVAALAKSIEYMELALARRQQRQVENLTSD